MMETPNAMLNAGSDRRGRRRSRAPGSRSLVMGLNDLAKETRARLDARPRRL